MQGGADAEDIRLVGERTVNEVVGILEREREREKDMPKPNIAAPSLREEFHPEKIFRCSQPIDR